MEYSTFRSDIIDTLEFLRPPVKRNFYKINRTVGVNTSTFNARNYICEEILRQNNPQKVLEQYPNVNYTSILNHKEQRLPVKTANQNICKEKPLIQVTVIPKTVQTQSRKLYKRRRHHPKVQSSVSNQENSIAKNVCVVNADKKREQIHEIKATGSAKFPNKRIARVTKHEEHISHCKQLLESLNMEVKKKRDKKKKKPNDFEVPDSVRERCYDCGCWENTRNEIQTDLKEHKNRVRIYGRVGVTENDRYVVDYAATVDEKPIHTINYSPVERNAEVSPIFLANNGESRFMRNININGCASGTVNNSRPYQRDFNIQTDIRGNETAGPPLEPDNSWLGKESQGTQVNFNITVPNYNNAKKYETKDQKIQCDCHNIVASSYQDETTNRVEECHSPLVIISVYPKQDSTDFIKTVTCSKGAISKMTAPFLKQSSGPERTPALSPKRNTDKSAQLQKATSRNRSPSPERNIYMKKRETNKKQDETKFNRCTKKPASSNYQAPLVSPSSPKVERKNIVSNRQNTPRIIESTWHQTTNRNTARSMAKKTEQMLAKQALVEDFTKRMTEGMEKPATAWTAVKNGTSKVTVNIDSENEHYDVLLQQGKLTTDLTVRRNKKVSPRRIYDQLEGTRSPPPGCFKKGVENCRDYVDKTLTNAENDEQNLSRLNVRDSLEIFHRRDNGQNTSTIKTQSKSNRRNAGTVDNDFLAPIKHYRGDDCNLPNPIERDKQIRELLGIETHQYQAYNVEKNEEGFLRCIMKECTKHLPMNVTNYPECTCNCRRIRSVTKATKLETHNIEESNIQRQKAKIKCFAENSTQYDHGPVERNLYQQLILNRNIQVFLQVDQFNKQKPIVLSRQQYDKVKRTIQDTINKKGGNGNKRKRCFCKSSIVSIGEIREKTKQEVAEPMDKGVQATKVKEDRRKSSKILNWIKKDKESKKRAKKEVRTLVLFNSSEVMASNFDSKISKELNVIQRRQTVSSVEIRFANVDMKRVQFSNINMASEITSHLGQSRSDSLITIYKVSGPKKSVTPNLGTSIVSGGVSDTKSVKFLMTPRDVKQKKPFLQRLISCLVVHSTRDSVRNTPRRSLTPSINSSIDSYHISSSLGGIEITSSLYDTSASFYSNHSILQVNNKMKRGFFSSVREFLTNRKS